MRPDNRYNRGKTLVISSERNWYCWPSAGAASMRLLWPAPLIDRFGEDCPAIDIRPLLRCSACRTRNANLHETGR
jgi:hypothetical protein